MRKLYRKLIFITCFSMFCTACAPQYSGKVPPKVVNGEIDLTDWDFEKDGPVKLDGDWLFAWEKFLEPASWEELQKQMGFKVKAPAKWINLQNSSLPANLSNGIGFASYALKIKGLSSQDPGFFFNELYTSANVFLLEESGLIIGQTSQGKPAEQPSDELPLININLQFTPYEYKPAAIQNDIEESARILLIHLSSQQVKYGGVWSSIILSDHENIKLLAWRDILLLGVSFGTFLIIAFYHITLYLQRRADLTSLYFGLFSFALALRVFSLGVAQYSGFNESIDHFDALIKIRFLSLPLVIVSFSYFFSSLFKEISFFSRFAKLMAIVSFVLVGFTALSPPRMFIENNYIFHVQILVFFIFTFYGLISMTIQGGRLAFILILSFVVVATGSVNDILYAQGLIQTTFIGEYTTITFVLIQASLISVNNANAYRRSEALSTKLSTEVGEKDFLNKASAVGKHQDIESAVGAFFALVKDNFNINVLSYLKIDQESNKVKAVLFDHPPIEEPAFINFRDNYEYTLNKSLGSLYLAYLRKKPWYVSSLADSTKLDQLTAKLLKFRDFLQIPLVLEKEVIGIVCACRYEDKMNLTRNEVNLLNSACQGLSGLFRAYSLNASLTQKIEHNRKLSQSNEELAAQKSKYNKMISELSFEFAQAGEQLESAKAEQQQITKELKEASNQLIQAEKLSGLGAMVSGIAHDINNPLNFIETARFQEQEKLDQLKDHLLGLVPEGEEGKEFKADLLARFDKLSKLNEQIKAGVTRVTEISKSMRNASRADTDKTNGVNLVEVIEESLIITGNKVKQFQLINNTPDGIPLASCNRSQIGQVVMNFLSNAADALAEFKDRYKDHKGTIQVDLAISNQIKDQNQPRIVQISISDNGSGVPQENRDKVLNAFFTTKEAGLGTGLGLAIAGKVAQAHDGSIYIDDGLPNDHGGYGARFTFEFLG